LCTCSAQKQVCLSGGKKRKPSSNVCFPPPPHTLHRRTRAMWQMIHAFRCCYCSATLCCSHPSCVIIHRHSQRAREPFLFQTQRVFFLVQWFEMLQTSLPMCALAATVGPLRLSFTEKVYLPSLWFCLPLLPGRSISFE
jgi:hypothetical protein